MGRQTLPMPSPDSSSEPAPAGAPTAAHPNLDLALLGSSSASADDGHFSIELESLQRTEQCYDPGTAIVRTRLFDTSGQGIEIADFAPRFPHHGRTFRPSQLVRRVRPLNGHPRVRVVVRPRGEWGSITPTLTRGSNHLRYVMPST